MDSQMVKFIQHTPIHYGIPASMIRQGLTLDNVNKMKEMVEQLKVEEQSIGFTEIMWQLSGKPYFEVYPKVIEGLRRTNLNVKPSDIPKSILHDINHLCVKFPSGIMRYSYMLMTVTPSSYKGIHEIYIMASDGEAFTEATATDEQPLTESIGSDWADDMEEAAEYNNVMKIAIGVMMLASDPDYIKPVLLKADENKTTPLEERIERAKRRGVFGFTIGEEIERSPHFRRPHFAIRWTGKGGSIPKLVPVKGSVIGKELMTTVPTGFEVDG
tara:strand:- start:56 stop:868 length:813 start_codon:yes stop_codon:yes gene_type:complete